MPKITVTAKIDGGIHLKYGEIIKGKEYEIEEEHFGDQLFERPPGFESPFEKAERERIVGAPLAAPDPIITDQGAAPARRTPAGGSSAPMVKTRKGE